MRKSELASANFTLEAEREQEMRQLLLAAIGSRLDNFFLYAQILAEKKCFLIHTFHTLAV